MLDLKLKPITVNGETYGALILHGFHDYYDKYVLFFYEDKKHLHMIIRGYYSLTFKDVDCNDDRYCDFNQIPRYFLSDWNIFSVHEYFSKDTCINLDFIKSELRKINMYEFNNYKLTNKSLNLHDANQLLDCIIEENAESALAILLSICLIVFIISVIIGCVLC